MNYFDGSAPTLNHLCLQTDRPEVLKDFYAAILGYEFHQHGECFIGIGPQRCLIIERGSAKTLSYAAFSVTDAGNLKKLSQSLKQTGVRFESSPSPVFDSAAFALRDPDDNLLVFGIEPTDDVKIAAEVPATPRVAGNVDDRPPVKLPGRMQHVVVATPRLPELVRFYSDVLGFGIADRVVDVDGELRACFFNSDTEHHSFAAFSAAESRLDHHAYETGSWNTIRDWADQFARFDCPVMWGPGRHGVGNNLFAMFEDPDKNWIEVSAELEQISPQRTTGQWQHDDRALNLWGRAIMRS